MNNTETFAQVVQTGYTFNGAAITLGEAMLDGTPVSGALIKLPLSTLNRHGLWPWEQRGVGEHGGMSEMQDGLSLTRPAMSSPATSKYFSPFG